MFICSNDEMNNAAFEQMNIAAIVALFNYSFVHHTFIYPFLFSMRQAASLLLPPAPALLHFSFSHTTIKVISAEQTADKIAMR